MFNFVGNYDPRTKVKVDGDRMLQLHRDTFFIPVIDIFLTITNARLRPRSISVGSSKSRAVADDGDT